MPTLPDDTPTVVTGGVDTHKDVHVAAVIDDLGRILGTESFPTDQAGLGRLLRWMRKHGTIARVGVEGTGSYGAGLARYLAANGVEIVEVNRPNRQARRRRGKSDPADAEAAARAALNGEASARYKGDGRIAGLRCLRVARRGAVKARTQAANQINDMLLTAPQALRDRLRPLTTKQIVDVAVRFRPRATADCAELTKSALRSLARRYQTLSEEIDQLDVQLAELVTDITPPKMLERMGVGVNVAASLLIAAGDNPERLSKETSFAALCGSSPVDASSGKQKRHRLNRGGDRQAHAALWWIVFTRMTHDPRTRAYVERRTKEGKTRKEIMRCLNRYVAREMYKLLTDQTRTSTSRTAAGAT